jgi:hypothetical protein
MYSPLQRDDKVMKLIEKMNIGRFEVLTAVNDEITFFWGLILLKFY